MKKHSLISMGIVVLVSVAFIAGRGSVDRSSPIAEPAAPARVKPITPGRNSMVPEDGPRSARPEIPSRENADALLNQLAHLSINEGEPRSARPVLALLEELSRVGPKASPAIRRFLESGTDVTYPSLDGKRPRNVRSSMNALVPPSLRLGLFDIVVRSSGADAEEILAGKLADAKSGLELACLSEWLQEMSPGRHRDAIIAAVTGMLAKGGSADRNLLFEIMKSLGDTSYVATAQQQVILPDGRVDRDALRYLQQTMGTQSLALAARTYQDPRLAEPGSKEPLARVALSYVGSDPQALDLFHTALLDSSLLPDQKRNLVEDLNEGGLSNRKVPTPEDLQIIARRYELTQAYLRQDYVQNDAILNAAFREADKDLRKMLERAATTNPPR